MTHDKFISKHCLISCPGIMCDKLEIGNMTNIDSTAFQIARIAPFR